jgi:tripartite-type tricarboxylate transporter receptor subunit TctC
MTPTFARRALLTALPALLTFATTLAQADDAWPTKPVRLVVGFSAGGTTDVMARAVAQPLGEVLRQPVIIDNKPGASGNLAAADAIAARPDGSTWMVAPTTVQSANPSLFKSSIDPAKGLVPVAAIGRSQLYLVARNGLAQDGKELLAKARAQPGKLAFASGGPGTSMHLVAEMFKRQAKIDTIHVPYRGVAPALQDVMAGQVDYVFDTGTSFQHVRAGKARMLAVASAKRSSFVPDVPTLGELGVPGVELDIWFGVWAPAGTPQPVIDRMAAELAKAVALPVVKQRFHDLGAEATSVGPAEFRSIIASETQVLSGLIRDAKIAVD